MLCMSKDLLKGFAWNKHKKRGLPCEMEKAVGNQSVCVGIGD